MFIQVESNIGYIQYEVVWFDLLSIEHFELEHAVAVASRYLHHEVVEVRLQALGQCAGIAGPAQHAVHKRFAHFGYRRAHSTHNIWHGLVPVRLLVRAGLLLV